MTTYAEAPWAKLPLHLLHDDSLTLGDIRVYALIDFNCGKRGYWYGSQTELASTAGVSEGTVRRAVRRLAAIGYISIKRLGLTKNRVFCYSPIARAVAIPAGTGSHLPITRDRSGAITRDRYGAAARDRYGAAARDRSSTTDPSTDPSTDPPSPSGRADGDGGGVVKLDERQRAISAIRLVLGRTPGGSIRSEADWLLARRVPAEWFEEVSASSELEEARTKWPYMRSVLEHWRQHGHRCTCKRVGAGVGA